MIEPKLKFAKGNAKLGKHTAIFSLPAGFTCPGALQCLSMANRVTGRLTDGEHTLFRCYAASNEVLFPNVRESRWRNYELLKGKSVAEMVEVIMRSLPGKVTLCRIHASGDFFNQDYFDAWILVAKKMPHIIFYTYTKMLPLWIRRINAIPANFRIVASEGGKFDSLITEHNLRYVKVVFSESHAEKLGLPIDHDDTHAWDYDGNFSLLLHGTQKANSEASKAWQKIKTEGHGGYKTDYFAHYAKQSVGTTQ